MPVVRKVPVRSSANAENDYRLLAEAINSIKDALTSGYNDPDTFTPSWDGFSVDPSGDITYLDLGATVLMWIDSALTGTSDTTALTIVAGSVPQLIRPTANRVVPCSLIDESADVMGTAVLDTTGQIQFGLNQISVSPDVIVNFSGWNSAGTTKGLPAGWTIAYPK